MQCRFWIVVVAIVISSITRLLAEEIKLPATKGASNKLIAEIGNRELASLSNVEKARLASAYNNLHQPVKAFEACDSIPEKWLAENGLLGSKTTFFHNLRRAPGQKDVLVRELAFAQRCLDRNYGNRRAWLLSKASILCSASVRHDEAPDGLRKAVLIDAEQLEQAFETLRLAKSTPRITGQPTNVHDFDEYYLEGELAAEFFPLLSEQDRYQQLIANKAQ